MSPENVKFIADLHLGHNNMMAILQKHGQAHLRGNCADVEEHDAWVIEQWNASVSKNDIIYVLGDSAFNERGLKKIARLTGNKILLRGNHDQLSLNKYLKVFNNVIGFKKKFGYWLSHAPIHPGSLRGKRNIHGHIHAGVVRDHNGEPDDRFICVSVEHLGGRPISLAEIKDKYE